MPVTGSQGESLSNYLQHWAAVETLVGLKREPRFLVEVLCRTWADIVNLLLQRTVC